MIVLYAKRIFSVFQEESSNVFYNKMVIQTGSLDAV